MIYRPLKQLLIALLLISIGCSKSQKKTSSPLKELSNEEKANILSKTMQRLLENAEIIPAISITVVGENGILLKKTIGYSDMVNQIPVNEHTNFYLASVTKSFSGLLTHILAKDLNLDLHKDITFYKPFKNFKDQSLFKGISILDLISHQSGLDNDYLSFRLSYSGDYNREDIIRLIEHETFKLPQGKSFNYSNLGYYFLSEILFAEFGKDWKDLIHEKVLEPLKMARTTTTADFNYKRTAMPHLGFSPEQITISQIINTNETMHVAGGIISNSKDLAKFLYIYINNGKVDSTQVLDSNLIKNSYKQLIEIPFEEQKIDGYAYGSGWILKKLFNKELVYHNGAFQGYLSDISFMPNKKIGVAICFNHGFHMSLIHELRKYIYALYLEGDKKAESIINPLFKKLPSYIVEYRKNYNKKLKALTTSNLQLTLPNSTYTGEYFNKNLGTVVIKQTETGLFLRCGNLKGHAMRHQNINCIKVGLTTPLGEDICFELSQDSITGLRYRENLFLKLK